MTSVSSGANACKIIFFLKVLCIYLVKNPHTVYARPQAVPQSLNATNNEYTYVSSWPILERKLGSVSAVAIDGAGDIVIFHRASHVWTLSSFDTANRYLEATGGPIDQHTVLRFHHETGQLQQEWGDKLFYMPHGLTIDHEGNYWLTDVALHQVFKFNLNQSVTQPELALGTRFEPGDGMYHFCKPTAVAVMRTGEFFVADGYCNGRIVKYSADGLPILSWGRNSFALTRTFTLPPGPVPESFFAIPHALTLANDRELLCVADREQGRVQCFHTGNGTFHSQYSSPEIGSRLFSVKYIPIEGGLLYTINGPQFDLDAKPVGGYIIEMVGGRVVGRFQPNNTVHAFSNPHELAVTDDGAEVYVAELNPQMVHKFRRTRVLSSPSPTFPREQQTASGHFVDAPEASYKEAMGGTSDLTAGSIGIFSIVSTLIVTSLLVILMARVICFRSGASPSQFDEVPLRNMGE
ncbi:peptidyl-alpha-hydroxyglycine alpha-amidating lyase 1 isoform X2 [Anopheles nili]|uniref:peptidyl-alpha-hydroxyglycine alpha-amidating lyase 1 isoform X2 n=1 Tax=Anopheles nili TaxID=185578 RepID=UPI00237B3823|nr:peptidyl-alpha-hydroxyglycine alpha-amidating lyase 1 isoform X2 [Anopheles nili]